MLTFKGEDFVPSRVEVLPLDVRRQCVSLVWKQWDLDVRVRRPTQVLGGQSLGSNDFDGEGLRVEVVGDAEVDSTQLVLGCAAGAREELVPVTGARVAWIPQWGAREPVVEVDAARQAAVTGQLGQGLTELRRRGRRLYVVVRIRAALDQHQIYDNNMCNNNKYNNNNITRWTGQSPTWGRPAPQIRVEIPLAAIVQRSGDWPHWSLRRPITANHRRGALQLREEFRLEPRGV